MQDEKPKAKFQFKFNRLDSDLLDIIEDDEKDMKKLELRVEWPGIKIWKPRVTLTTKGLELKLGFFPVVQEPEITI